MYNDYDELSFEEGLQLTESEVHRRHNQRMFLQRNAQLLQQESELEAQLLEENPELAQTIHHLNQKEIQAGLQGVQDSIQGDLTPESQKFWSSVFPGL